MDLTAWLLRHTPPRPLLAPIPGGDASRLAAERSMRERGWRPAANPAEANLLVVAGAPDAAFEVWLRRVWVSMPAPRARVDIADPGQTESALDTALRELRDTAGQRTQATRHAPPTEPEHAEHSGGHGEHAAHGRQSDHAEHASDGDHADHPGHGEQGGGADHADHAGHGGDSGHATDADHPGHGEHANPADDPGHSGHANHADHPGHGGGGGQADHGGHGGHDHHMGGMAMPGGIPMADRAADRDGLMLDQLHVPLGPVLPLWPAGLIVHTRLQGDVIQDATVEVHHSLGGSFWSTQPPVARRLDATARLLALAGWTDAAVTAQRLRDAALAGALPTDSLDKWAGRVTRSRALRWLLAGLGDTSATPGTPDQLAGDALTRLHRRLADEGGLSDRDETQWTVDNLPTLLAGADLAAARLIVASLDPDLALLEAHHA